MKIYAISEQAMPAILNNSKREATLQTNQCKFIQICHFNNAQKPLYTTE